MPGSCCAVAVCSNNSKLTKIKKLNVSYHRFPRNNALRKAWTNACRRKDIWNPSTSFICSVHFSKECFETNLMNELMGEKCNRRLKSTGILLFTNVSTQLVLISTTIINITAVPNEFLRKEDFMESTANANERDIRKTKREMTSTINQLLVEASVDTIEVKYDKLLKDYEALEKQCADLKSTNVQLQSKIKELDNQLLQKSKQLSDSVVLNSQLQGNFSKTQIEVLLKKKKKRYVF